MQPRSSVISATLTTTLAILVAGPSLAQAQDTDPACAASGATGGDAAAPCFTNVSDILGGQRDLLRNDDLLMSVVLPSDGDDHFVSLPFHTTNLKPAPDSETAFTQIFDCPDAPAEQATRLGRVYALPYDVMVTYVTQNFPSGCSQTLFVNDPVADATLHGPFGGFPSIEPRMALFDANLDGYDDILVMGFESSTNHNFFMQMYAPDDPTDPTAEPLFKSQIEVLGADTADYTPRSNVVTGDFNGDGAQDIAWAGAADGGAIEVRFASVCPAVGQVVLGTTCAQAFDFVLSSQTIGTGESWTIHEKVFPFVSLGAGDFDGVLSADTGLADAELVLIKQDLDNGAVSASAYDFAAALEPHAADEKTLQGLEDGIILPGIPPPFVVSGLLDGAGRQAQAVVGASTVTTWGLWVLSFSETLEMTVATTGIQFGISSVEIISGVAIGRFDPPPDGSDPDFNQQIAVLFSEVLPGTGDDPQTVLDIFTVDPPDFTPKRLESARTVIFDQIPLITTAEAAEHPTAPLQAGDLQGRSLRLGAPEKTTVVHTQIDTVLGMPPMHVDFITPPDGSEPEVYNVSVFPDVFNSAYQFTSSQNSSATSKSTTSYTYSTKESFEEKISYGIPDIADVSVSATQAATQKHTSTVASEYDTYTGNTYTLDASTVFDDTVAFSTKRMNVYSYPVIGHSVCPAASPGCPADCGAGPSPCPALPLHVQFSGVDNTIAYKAPVAAGVLEWYQPVNEPGTLFSYPGNLAQLAADQPQQQAQGSTAISPRLTQLSAPTEWSTSDDDSVALTWSTGSAGSNTVGSVSNHSFDASVTVSGSAEIAGVGLDGSAAFDYSSSSSISTLNSNTLTLDESDGVTLDLRLAESTNPNPRQDYAGASYIFGLQAPVGVIQSDVQKDTAVTLPATGPLQVASVADMVSADPQSSDWWPIAYGAAPDVALNHPQRWTQTLPADPDPEIVWFNCPIGFTSSSVNPNCTPSTPPQNLPQVAAETPFYWMKGLFVTPGVDSSGPPTTGATRGDTLTLRARVYNYSLANIPDETEVHVAFYAQPWDGTGGQFLSAAGNPDAFAPAVFIDEVVLAPIPAFCGGLQASIDPCSEPDAPRNWVFAETTWDTGTLAPTDAATYWKFWLVTWMENAGRLVEELPGHGLSAIPGADLTSFLDVPIETYSNNTGFYNQVFALRPPSGSAAAPALAATEAWIRPPAGPELRVTSVRLSPKRRLRGRIPTVRAALRSNQALDDVLVRFFDGDPAEDGVLFDAEMIPHLPAHERFVVAVPYQQAGCGARRLFVEAVVPGDPPVAPALAASHTRFRGHRACR